MKRLRRLPRVDAGVAARVVPAVLRVALPVRQAPRVRRVVLAVDKVADPVARRLRRPLQRRSIK